MSKTATIIKTIIRFLIGLMFVVSAVLKLFSLDSFEIYIYSLDFFGFVMSGFVARCVIAAELLLGCFLIAKILYKPAWWLTMAMMVVFTLFLVYVVLFRNDANCHCMGELVELNPAWSIVKNLVLILLLLLIRKEDDWHFRGKVALGISLLVASVAVPFALFPMDSFYQIFSREEQKVDMAKFSQFMQDSTAQTLHLDQGDYVIGYLASGCKYCTISATKINTIFQNNQLDSTKLVFMIWGSEKSVRSFQEETETQRYRYESINPVEALNIVFGQFPTYVYVRNGKVERVAN
ncbi:MAG: DoxX family protein, partial [Bacteroidales bacterium]|nr:DoxX family protein [Bacteroidales bacterium]